ncbi:hypothetical protein [Aquimarina sp. RZ0]|uniref:hypothetical protein n=1 Tax=Aquimarina sp. RZ0 TaxID=2607730 RepID=UPI0011F0D19B|nr:hypothetical protein [Aquimarina sp. RZ0]KAA1243917.1 hypothetical protein F0000_18825 [Aquimarina sp. RZ0]
MKIIISLITIVLSSFAAVSQTKTIHVFVALCDNIHQGIVPVPDKIGNGQDPKNNLYWGAGYGVKNFFKVKTKDWQLIQTVPSDDPIILERLLFKHITKDIYVLADAYDGAKIKDCTENFLRSANGQLSFELKEKSKTLDFGGGSDLLAYVGHNGLMDFESNPSYQESVTKIRDIIILACYSKRYFEPQVRKAKANPILWTTHLMAPEAYTLKSAIDGWIANESGEQIDERAAQSYHTYQKCGIRGARNLFTTGF